nr:MAG TPA: hypothetical protein [Caudoviricetes sp.]
MFTTSQLFYIYIYQQHMWITVSYSIKQWVSLFLLATPSVTFNKSVTFVTLLTCG